MQSDFFRDSPPVVVDAAFQMRSNSIIIPVRPTGGAPIVTGVCRQRRKALMLAANKEPSLEEAEDYSDAKSGTSNNYPEDEDPDDPRAFQRRMRAEQLSKYQKQKQGIAASAAMDLPEQPLVKTIPGGANMLFAMARTMAQSQQSTSPPATTKSTTGTAPGTVVDPPTTASTTAASSSSASSPSAALPRWHPTTPPSMNSQAYAATIWRNARKRQKPALWRYALRTFDRMQKDSSKVKSKKSFVDITNIHYEGALVAASKLGWSETALDIYETVKVRETKLRNKLITSSTNPKKRLSVQITDSMLLSLTRACVKDAIRSKDRTPLDTVVDILELHQNTHALTAASHWNRLARAYQRLECYDDAERILDRHLADPIGGPEAELVVNQSVNVNDVQAKDKASYALFVNNAISQDDWGGAAAALKQMTQTGGFYPSTRHLNTWTEISDRKTRKSSGWKKKRDIALSESTIAAALQYDHGDGDDDQQ